MRILSTDVYGGPNRFALFPCVLHVVDLEELEQWSTTRLGDAFIDGLVKALKKRNAELTAGNSAAK